MQIIPGMRVVDERGHVGWICEVQAPNPQSAATLIMRDASGQLRTLPPDSYTVADQIIHLTGPYSSATHSSATTQQLESSELRIPVVHEEIVVHTQQVESGGVRVHKHVNTREELVEQPITYEDVAVRRVPIGQVVEQAPAQREEGDTLIIPVLEEVLVIQKQLVLKEEIHITRRRIETVQQTPVVLREEHVTLEAIDSGSYREAGGSDQAATTGI